MKNFTLVFTFFSFFISSFAQTATITYDGVVVRQLPARSSKQVSKLAANTQVEILELTPKGKSVKILGKNYGWHKIQSNTAYGNVTGYVCSKYVNINSPKVKIPPSDNSFSDKGTSIHSFGIVNFDKVKVRVQPSTKSKLVSQVSKNTRIQLLEKTTSNPVYIQGKGYGWYQVKFEIKGNTLTGFVCEKYISIAKKSEGKSIGSNDGNSNSKDINLQNKGIVNFHNASLRKAPNVKSPLIAKLRKSLKTTIINIGVKGKAVEIGNTTYEWMEIQATQNGKMYKGYICAKYITLQEWSNKPAEETGIDKQICVE